MTQGSQQSLTGKAVVITGAGRGLGAAYARHAAAAGASIVVNDIDARATTATVDEIIRAGGRAVAHTASVSDWDAAEGLIKRCVDEFGRVDGLVNNAGMFVKRDAHECGPGDVQSIVEANVLGTIFCGIHALRVMYGQGGGTIVNVTSGALLGIPGMSLYGASKGAVASLTFGWAKEASARGVRVNAVSPVASTRMSAQFGLPSGASPPDYRSGGGPRGQRADDVAPVVTFLLSDLSGDLNGCILRLFDGGLSIVEPPRVSEVIAQRADWRPEDFVDALDVRPCRRSRERDLSGVAAPGGEIAPIRRSLVASTRVGANRSID